ncbi:ThiF family adenylyltransferase [Actinomycetospora chibensis]|uniref:ThiF family adenylyltransferase n=1 Tax=Actinomycetospora chibensis TaxID=663606 RepID=A0ABV9RHS3_9PSEU|nr:hypothetical protein [Actinomycetospora chibensis]
MLSPVPTLPRSSLPGRPRLRHAALHRAPDVLQFGADPAEAVVVDGLTPPLVRMVDALDGTRSPARVLAEAVAAGAAPVAARDLLEHLHAAGLLVGAPRTDPLAGCRVVVRGAGRVAVSVACLLAAAGVGRVLVEAGGTVVRDDVGTGLLAGDVGRPSAWAVADAVARASPGIPPPADAPARRWLAARADLVVLADGARPDPVATSELVVAGRVHLPVGVVDGVGTVGPLVVPGMTPCLRCEDLRRTDVDPVWPRVAAELAGRRVAVPVALAAATAALAAGQSLAHLEGAVPAARGAALVLEPDGTHRSRPARRHPDCGCRALTVRPATSRHPMVAA